MTKHELAKRVATDAGITAGQAASVVDAAFDVIAGELAAGRDVRDRRGSANSAWPNARAARAAIPRPVRRSGSLPAAPRSSLPPPP